MGIDLKTLAAAKKYTQETVGGSGALKGNDGKSAYQIALDNGFVGSEEQWIESLKGRHGKDGLDGFSPTITENPKNDDKTYKLDITDINGTRTTPNLKGKDSVGNGDGGTSNYDELDNRPQINGVTLQGNKSLDDLGIQSKGNYITEIPEQYITEEKLKEYAQPKGDYLTEIPDDYITENDLNDKCYLTEIPENYITDDTLDEKLGERGYLTDIPIATIEILGGVKPDGETITVDRDGTIHTVVGSSEDGKTYIPAIGTVQSGDEAKASIDIDKQELKAKFNFTLPRGEKGADGLPGASGIDGKDGRSITSIRTDENNNVYVTFSDNKEEFVGTLNFDVQSDFLTVEGFGKLRYYQNHFQYYNDDTQDWVDTVVTSDNIYVVNMTPLPMKSIVGKYDYNIEHYKLKWAESPDTVIDGQVMCIVDKVIIRRKQNTAPIDINDGDFVIELPRRHFGTYKTKWYVDESFKPNLGDTYCYKAFPISATTEIYSNSPMNEVTFTANDTRDYELYGFEIDQNESDPDSMIKYIEDNVGWNPAHMNYNTDLFDYGDWTQENAFFMNVRPCMLKYDGTVAYYLNPNDYAYKEDGTPSDISNVNFDGNAMVQFPKIYWKITDMGNNRAEIRISNKNVDGSYVCWSHIDENGDEIPYCYMPMYNGYLDKNDRLRSLSGKTPMHSKTAQQEITYAIANNLDEKHAWYTEIFSDRQLVNLLLLLIGKSTDTQAVFGYGYSFGGSETVNPRLQTGTMNDKGMFWGKNTETMDGVKCFYIENWFGNQWRRVAGWINDMGVQKVKMAHGQSDDSIVDRYNLTGNGYVAIPGSTPNGTTGGYISVMVFSDKGLIPKTASGTATTHYADGLWFNNSLIDYARVGGSSNNGFLVGALCARLASAASDALWNVGAAISCKPLLFTQQSDPNVNEEVA